jgi:hypothetical protein
MIKRNTFKNLETTNSATEDPSNNIRKSPNGKKIKTLERISKTDFALK